MPVAVHGPGALLAAFVAAVVVAAVTSPVGVSGAVFLLPVQVTVLGIPSPAVTPTNLLYNVLATPAALTRYARQWQVDRALAVPLLCGAVPGVVAGAWLRVAHLSGDAVLRVMLAGLLVPLGGWLLSAANRRPAPRPDPPTVILVGLSAAVGVIGGLVGVGGGSILAPVLAGLGLSLSRVAPTALLATFVTSLAGVATFAALAAGGQPAAAPDWSIGLALGAGGMVGGYTGARLQPLVRDAVLRRVLGAVAVTVGIGYALTALR